MTTNPTPEERVRQTFVLAWEEKQDGLMRMLAEDLHVAIAQARAEALEEAAKRIREHQMHCGLEKYRHNIAEEVRALAREGNRMTSEPNDSAEMIGRTGKYDEKHKWITVETEEAIENAYALWWFVPLIISYILISLLGLVVGLSI